MKIAAAFFLLFWTPSLFAGTYDPDSCREKSALVRNKSLTKLSLIDQQFNSVYWQRFRFYETVYGPLFNAKIQREDAFSPSVRAEGQVRFGRYQHEARVYHALSRQESKRLQKSLSELARIIRSASSCCSAHSFAVCHDEWQSLARTHLRFLKKALTEQESLLRTLAHRVTLSLLENLSEHYPFPDRYAQEWEHRQLHIVPQYLNASRGLRELFEIKNPQDCCSNCTRESMSSSEDPVLRAVKPDTQGERGISGEIINKGSVLKAFRELDRRQEN